VTRKTGIKGSLIRNFKKGTPLREINYLEPFFTNINGKLPVKVSGD